MTCDVREHACYPDFHLARGGYSDALRKIVDWDLVAAIRAAAKNDRSTRAVTAIS